MKFSNASAFWSFYNLSSAKLTFLTIRFWSWCRSVLNAENTPCNSKMQGLFRERRFAIIRLGKTSITDFVFLEYPWKNVICLLIIRNAIIFESLFVWFWTNLGWENRGSSYQKKLLFHCNSGNLPSNTLTEFTSQTWIVCFYLGDLFIFTCKICIQIHIFSSLLNHWKGNDWLLI